MTRKEAYIGGQKLQTYEETLSKISAFADDTAVHVGSIEDITVYQETLGDYFAATGGITNLAKSEAVLLGSWRQLKPDRSEERV